MERELKVPDISGVKTYRIHMAFCGYNEMVEFRVPADVAIKNIIETLSDMVHSLESDGTFGREGRSVKTLVKHIKIDRWLVRVLTCDASWVWDSK